MDLSLSRNAHGAPRPPRKAPPPNKLLFAALLTALASAPLTAAVTSTECQNFADEVVLTLAAENPAVATSSGCPTATSFQVCDAEGEVGPCSFVSACNTASTVLDEGCSTSNEADACCVVMQTYDCSGSSCSTAPNGVCGQYCDAPTSTPSTPSTRSTFSPPSPRSTPSSSSDDDDSNVGLAVGVSLAVIAVVAAVVGVLVYVFCCRKKNDAAAQPLKATDGYAMQGTAPPVAHAMQTYPQTNAQPPPPPQHPYTYNHTHPGAPQPGPPPPPPPANPYPQPLAQNWQQPAQYAPPPPPGQPYTNPAAAAAYPGASPPPTSYGGSQPGTVHARSTASATESSAAPGTFGTATAHTGTYDSQAAVNPYALVATQGSTHGQTTFGQSTVVLRRPPPPGAKIDDRKEFLHHQLDTLVGQEVLEGLVLEPGMSNRMQGGQAVIQFAKDRRTSVFYALKFFLSNTAFGDEAALYTKTNSPLGHFLPQLRNIVGAVGHGGPIVDAHGQPLPPCIVMEKGESLDVWMKRNRDGMDMVTGLQVIQHVAERLSDLHQAGYVHRDLKQSNVMWLPRENRWTLIDFGCAARIGEDAPLSYSVSYAPPEVISAVRGGQRTIIAQTSMDAWTLGIVAVELFSNRPTFDRFEGTEQIMAKIVGEQPLPWEVGAPGSQELLRKLGRFKPGVLGLLQRDPQQRLTISAFISRCRSVLEQTVAA